jgi:serine phosphatase RsbU (regulator of sigma subunit)
MRKIISVLFVFFSIVFFSTFLCGGNKTNKIDTTKKDTTINININLSEFISEDEEDKEKSDSVLQALNDIDNLVKFNNPWKIKSGDDSTWALPSYDDSSWTTQLQDSIRDNKDYGSITWYRMHFEIDTNLINVPLAFYVQQFGSACDVYLDGKFLKSYGKVGRDKESEAAQFSVNPKPFAFVFTGGKTHLFAVRYSNFHRADAKGSGIKLGKNFKISVKNLNEEIEEAADPSQYFPIIFFSAIFLTLAVVHLIMFIYYRQKITNLYYSLYCFGVFAVVYYLYYLITSTDYTSIVVLSKTARFLAPLLVLPLVAMLHKIFYEKLLKIFRLLTILYFLSLATIALDYVKATSVVVAVLFMLAVVEIIRVIIKSIKKRKDGAWIFSLALFLPFITGIVLSFFPDSLNIGGLIIELDAGTFVSSSFVLGLPLSMTLFLARDFARMSKKLKVQLSEITGLSEKTIAQEKEKKQILENQNTQLEKKVFERTQEVWEQKEVIEIKNKEITESLVYAKRIQSAILPDIKLIYKTLEQSFILYLPKDIVSGDFYGFAQKNNRVIIAAADCTGHGVAGAFMSMIGSALLNQIINEKNITAPSHILDQLNEEIIYSLKQKESESHDGMDISVCAFDLIANTVDYAGANRPLWLIRNKEIIVYKPNKFPIGGLQVIRQEKFSQYNIQLQKSDTLYLFSDGFADQFGGERGKKLMTKKFKDTLLSIQELNMQEQQNYLLHLFNSWKGNNEQVDDVLVIGIKI